MGKLDYINEIYFYIQCRPFTTIARIHHYFSQFPGYNTYYINHALRVLRKTDQIVYSVEIEEGSMDTSSEEMVFAKHRF